MFKVNPEILMFDFTANYLKKLYVFVLILTYKRLLKLKHNYKTYKKLINIYCIIL